MADQYALNLTVRPGTEADFKWGGEYRWGKQYLAKQEDGRFRMEELQDTTLSKGLFSMHWSNGSVYVIEEANDVGFFPATKIEPSIKAGGE